MISVRAGTLHTKVLAFRKWAEKYYPERTEDNDNGEWCFGTEFDEMYDAAVELIENEPAEAADEQVIDDLLYALARDNECELIAQILEDHDDWFSLLCRKCMESPYTNAKWQLAVRLRNYSGSDGLKELIYGFLSSGDEYTERMALESLAYICPEKAEEYAVRFWERDKYEHDEYQKIMALHVLYKIKSAELEKYLRLAESSEYSYLRINAEEIRALMKKDSAT